MPRRTLKSKSRRRRHRGRSSRKLTKRRSRRNQRGGTLAFLEEPNQRGPIIEVGLRENPEGEYDNPDNVPLVRRAT
jgi:hypothetical protein